MQSMMLRYEGTELNNDEQRQSLNLKKSFGLPNQYDCFDHCPLNLSFLNTNTLLDSFGDIRQLSNRFANSFKH
mgnify:FL=1